MDKQTHDALNHIASLRIASRDEIGGGQVDDLLHTGLIEQVWIGSYKLTEKGHEARKESPSAAKTRPRRPRKGSNPANAG